MRTLHSICAVGDKSIVVTGSMITYAGNKAELYNCEHNVWVDLPELPQSRYYHASCSFKERFVYIFGGMSSNTDASEDMSIQVIDVAYADHTQAWTDLKLNPESAQLTQRYSLIAMQYSKEEIVILGGTFK